MTAISQKLPNLIGGVSQQPDTLKFSNQFRSCTNYYPDLTFGLAKRPGIRGIGKLDGAVSDGTWFTIFRDETEKYIIQFSKAGALKIWNARTGTQQTVNTPTASATSYATHVNSDDLAVLQINDYTFVLNRTKTVLEKTAKSPVSNPYAFVSINVVAYASTYSVILDGITFNYATPTTSTTQLNIGDIVSQLVSTINANPSYIATAIGNSIHIRRANNADFSISARGGSSGTAIEAFKGTVPIAAKLPNQFINGLKIKVEANPEASIDDYWVEFRTADNTASGAGGWVETIAPNISLGINEETMPHVIIRESNGTFTYRLLDVASANATNPSNTFTGVVSSATISGTPTGTYVVGQTFDVTGGTGSGLRLKVNAVKNITVTNDYAYNDGSGNFVIVSNVPTGSGNRRTTRYTFYVSNIPIGVSEVTVSYLFGIVTGSVGSSSLTIGTRTYSPLGTGNNRGMRIEEFRTNVIDTVTVERGGANYTISDVVTNQFGDSFVVTGLTSFTNKPDIVSGNFWKDREVGDAVTNPMPSFVGKQIHGISFYQNRLILMSGENVICSQAGDYFDFFLSTVITTVDSDPIDLSCGSLRPIQLRYAITTANGLLLFSDTSQYILQTRTDAFSPSSAEINTLSQYEQSFRVAPFDTGSSIVFIEEGVKAANVFEMAVDGQKATVVELTRTIPSYVPSNVIQFTGSSSVSTFAIFSNQDLNSLYLFRYFNAGERLMSSWFKWTLPGAIQTFKFDHDLLYVVLKLDNAYVLGEINLLTSTAGGAFKYEDQFIDLRLDLFDYNPTKVYHAGSDSTRICFKNGFESASQQPVLVSLDENNPGFVEELSLEYNAAAPTGQKYFVSIEGDQTSKPFALGYKYEAEAEMPSFYVVQEEGRKDTLNIPIVHRMVISSYESGPFKVTVQSDQRGLYTLTLPQQTSNLYPANTVPIIRNVQNVVPLMAKGTQVRVKLIADGVFPTAFTSINWEGTYNNKGIRAI